MKAWIWGLVLLLIVLHQDNWNWEDDTLVFGFLPMGLAYHAVLSIACSIIWLLATIYAWPDYRDELKVPSSAAQPGAAVQREAVE